MTDTKRTTLFTYLNQIYFKRRTCKYNKKIAPAYMLSMWLSHDNSLIDIVNNINSLQFSLRDDIIYEYYMNKVPKGKRWIRWSKKIPNDRKFLSDIEKEMENRKISRREAILITKFRRQLK